MNAAEQATVNDAILALGQIACAIDVARERMDAIERNDVPSSETLAMAAEFARIQSERLDKLTS